MTSAPSIGDLMRALGGVLSAKFGPGAIGRLGTIAISGCIIVAVLGLALSWVDPMFGGAAMLAIFVIIMFTLVKGFGYAEDHPHIAAMDGAQIARVMTHDSAQKSFPGAPPLLINSPPVENPMLAAPVEAEDTTGA